MPENDEIHVRAAAVTDYDRLRELLAAYLAHMELLGCEVGLVSLDWMMSMVAAGVDRHDPVVVATHRGDVIGAVFWVEHPLPLTVRTALGLGTFVVPQFRNQGIANRMRQLAVSICRTRRIQRISGVVHALNNPEAEASIGPLFKPVATVFQCDLS